MSQILSEWLNKDIGLSNTVPPTELDNCFRSGFLFGELLHRFTLQKDFDKFIASKSTDTWVANYIRLEPTFRQLGIPFNAQICRDLMNGKPGAAAKMLYQLRISLPKLKGQESDEIHQSDSKKHSQLPSYPTTPKKSTKSQFNVDIAPSRNLRHQIRTHEFFVENLKSKTKRIDYELEAISNKYQALQEEQELKKMRSMEAKKAKILEERLRQVEAIRETDRQRKKLQKSDFLKGKIPKTMIETMMLENEKKKLMMAKKRIEMARATAFQTYFYGVEQFEKNVLELIPSKEIDGQSQDELNSENTLDEALNSKLDKNASISKAIAATKPVEKKPTQNAEFPADYVESLKTRNSIESNSHDKKDLREKMILMATEEAQSNVFKLQEADQLYSKLIHESQEERRIASEINAIRKEKKNMIQNRLHREDQYKQQREKDFREALDREFILCQNSNDEYKKTSDTLLHQHQQIIQEKIEKKHQKNHKFCLELSNQIIDLSIKVAEYRILNDKFIPSKLYKEWINIFLSGNPLSETYLIDSKDDVVALERTDETNQSQDTGNKIERNLSETNNKVEIPKNSIVFNGIKYLDDLEFEDFLKLKGEWSIVENNTDLENPALSNLIALLLNSQILGDNSANGPKFPSLPLKLAVIGKKLSGKSRVCTHLSSAYGLKVISPDDEVQGFVKKYKNADITKETDEAVKEKIRVAGRMNEMLIKGNSIDDSILISITAEAIKVANNEVEQKLYGGWIIDDFPKSKSQAQLLEKELTGYEEPRPAKPGNLKRGKQPPLTKRKSLIAMSAGSDSEANANPSADSCLDMVIDLDIPNAVAFQLATGRRLDPLNNKYYHLEFSPPPKDDPGLFERLVPIDSNGTQLQFNINQFEEQEPQILEWYNKFKKIQKFQSNVDEASLFSAIKQAVDEIIERKEKEKVLKDQLLAEEKRLEQESANAVLTNTGNLGSNSNVHPEGQPAEGAQIASSHASAPQSAIGKKKNGPSKESLEIFHDQWVTLETNYTDTMKFIFRAVRREREQMIRYFYNVKQNYSKYLTRPDNKNSFVDAFQKQFNGVEEELRGDPDVKAELHFRTMELQDKLWDLTEKRKEEAEQERLAILNNRYLEDHAVFLANYFQVMLVLEFERFSGTKQLVVDYYKEAEGKILDEKNNPMEITLSLSQIEEPPLEPTPGDKKKDNKKVSPKTQRKQQAGANSPKKPNEADPVAEVQALMAPVLQKYNEILEYCFPNSGDASNDKKDDHLTQDLQEHTEIIKIEESIFRKRLEAIKEQCSRSLRELWQKAHDTLSVLDDWSIKRFNAEMQAIRDLVVVIREVIEIEIKIPNSLVLFGDQFYVDLQSIIVPQDAEVKPVLNLEKTNADAFSAYQLSNLIKSFSELAPKGFVQTKDFIENIEKIAAMNTSTELLPEFVLNMEHIQLVNYAHSLDPYETGFIDWKGFILSQMRILPVKSQEIIQKLCQTYQASKKDGLIPQNLFNSTNLWFEGELDNEEGFNRPQKLKELILSMFSRQVDVTPSATEEQQAPAEKVYENLFDCEQFLYEICRDDNPRACLTKIFSLIGDGNATSAELVSIFKRIYNFVDETKRMDDPKRLANPLSEENVKNIFTSLGKEKITADEFLSVQKEGPLIFNVDDLNGYINQPAEPAPAGNTSISPSRPRSNTQYSETSEKEAINSK